MCEVLREYLKLGQQEIEELLSCTSENWDSINNLSNGLYSIINAPGNSDDIQNILEGIDNLDFSGFAKISMQILDDKNNKFTFTPLHLQMLAELMFKKHFQMPKTFGLVDLYKEFVSTTFSIYYYEKKTLRTNVFADEVRDYIEEQLHNHLQRLALENIFPEFNQNNLININPSSKKLLCRTGLVSLKGNRLIFEHHSFAEYFLSEYLVNYIQTDENVLKLLLEKVLLIKDYSLIRKFFNAQLNTDPLPKFILSKEACSVIKTKLNESDSQDSVLHVATVENNEAIVNFLLDKLKDNKDILNLMVLKRGSFASLQRTALHIATGESHNEIMIKLLNSVKDDPKTLEQLVLKLDIWEETALIVTLKKGHNETIKLLINWMLRYPNIASKNLMQKTGRHSKNILHIAIDKGENETITTILNWINENFRETLKQLLLDLPDKYGSSILHVAAHRHKNDNIITLLTWMEEYLEEEHINTLILKVDNNKQTVLHVMVNSEQSESVKTLLRWLKSNAEETLSELLLKTASHVVIVKLLYIWRLEMDTLK